jgi:hypothetical protein
MKTRREQTCHCGSGKLPGVMRDYGWCCAECYNDWHHCPGPSYRAEDHGGCAAWCHSHRGCHCNCTPPQTTSGDAWMFGG